MRMTDQPTTIDFSTFIFSLGSSALIYLGATPNPQTQKMEKNLDAARQNIEILDLLKEKTKDVFLPKTSAIIPVGNSIRAQETINIPFTKLTSKRFKSWLNRNIT